MGLTMGMWLTLGRNGRDRISLMCLLPILPAHPGGNPFKTMMLSWKYTLPAFIVPFAFTLSAQGDGILLKGPLSGILWMTLVTLAGVGALAGAVGGWLLGTVRRWERLVLLIAGLVLYLAPVDLYRLLALVFMAGVMGYRWVSLKRENQIYSKGGLNP